MNRRKFLSAVSSGVAMAVPAAAITATWPNFLRTAFADKAAAAHAEDAAAGLAVVSEGFRRAQQAGKPLLVFIIPQDGPQNASAKWERGRIFGAWLNHGTPEQLWPLALSEVACATMDDLRRLVPTVGLGDPLMVVVETDAVPVTVTRLDAELTEPVARPPRPHTVEGWREQERQEDALIDRQTALLARLAYKGLVGGETTLARRAAQARTALPAELLAQLSSGTPSPDQIDRAAAIFWAAASPGPARTGRVAALAAAVKARLLHQRVPGSHWATSQGCGTQIEGHPDMGRGIACGMGHVPAKSARFLYFYTIPKDPKPGSGIIL